MTSGDLTGLILSYVYATAMLFGVEFIGKALGWKAHFTRKIIHIGAGLWVWAILYFFDNWYIGIIPFATFIVLNYVFYRLGVFKQMDGENETLGTVYFAISITVLYALLWRTDPSQIDRAPIATAAVMAMTLGDALASIIGRRWGAHPYTTFGHTRSWQGSAAMLVVSFLAIFATLLILPASPLSPNSTEIGTTTAAIMALVGALIATLAEALAPAGTDNLSVPLLVGAALVAMSTLG